MRLILILFCLLFIQQDYAQPAPQDSTKQAYLAEIKVLGKKFTDIFYPQYDRIYSLPEKKFIATIDSVRKDFEAILSRYKTRLDKDDARQQQTEIKYYFDKLLIEYPVNHDIYTGKTSRGPSSIPARLKDNLAAINDPALLSNADVTEYVKAFLSLHVYLELKKNRYKDQDNQYLNATWKLIPQFISNPLCRAFWKTDYLYNHIDNNGIKHIEAVYHNFKSTVTDTAYLNKVAALYTEDSIGRLGHIIRTYKTVGAARLDLHIFCSDSIPGGGRKPAIVYFHGGSWSEGKPDWFFSGCDRYAKKGWVACAVEYRTHGRYNTSPFESVMDARSAIRWLREHAGEFNIDTNKIVASGNSAGGHLVLATALADNWNEKTDHSAFSCVPNVLMVNAGVYDLTDRSTAWIRKDLEDKSLVKQISPNHLIRIDLPPTLMIHGTNDKSVPYASAKTFAEEMAKAGNHTIQFESLNGAGHYIWFDPAYSSEVSKLQAAFLAKMGY